MTTASEGACSVCRYMEISVCVSECVSVCLPMRVYAQSQKRFTLRRPGRIYVNDAFRQTGTVHRRRLIGLNSEIRQEVVALDGADVISRQPPEAAQSLEESCALEKRLSEQLQKRMFLSTNLDCGGTSVYGRKLKRAGTFVTSGSPSTIET